MPAFEQPDTPPDNLTSADTDTDTEPDTNAATHTDSEHTTHPEQWPSLLGDDRSAVGIEELRAQLSKAVPFLLVPSFWCRLCLRCPVLTWVCHL